MRKRTFFLSLIAFMVGVFIVREPIISASFQWYLKGYCRACFGGKLTYQDVHYENGSWVFDHPMVHSKKTLEDGGYRFIADQATVDASFSWSKRTINLAMNLVAPHMDVGQGAEELKRIIEKPCKKYHMFYVHTLFNVPLGTIHIHDFSNPQKTIHPLSYQVNLACKDTREGCISLWFDEQNDAQEHVHILISEAVPKNPQLEIHLNQLGFPSLANVVKGIWPGCSACEFSGGSLDGHVMVTLPENEAPYAQGEVVLRDLQGHHPLFECSANIPELTFVLAPIDTDQESLPSRQTLGHLDISKEASLRFLKAGEPFWLLEDIKGVFAFKSMDGVKLAVDARCINSDKERKFHVDGQMRFSEEQLGNFFLGLNLQSDRATDDVSFQFRARELGGQWSFAEVELLGFSQDEFAFVQHQFGQVYPLWNQVHVYNGYFDAAMLVYLNGYDVTEVKIENISAYSLEFAVDPWELAGGVKDASGSLSFGLMGAAPLESLHSDLNLAEGWLSLAGLDKAKWQFSDIHTNLAIRKGVIQKSLIKGEFAGLKGEIELDGTSSSPLMALNFNGPAKNFAQALPDSIRNGMNKKFVEDHLSIVATATKDSDSLLFNGKLLFKGKESQQDAISFGFSLEKSPQLLWGRWPPHPLAAEYAVNVGGGVLDTLIPGIALPASLAHHYLIQDKLGVAGFVINDGWFKADHLRLEKFVSPFAFQEDQMRVSGLGDFKGVFDSQGVVVNYNVCDMVLENSDFVIEVKNFIPEHSLSEKEDTDNLVATHVFDFNLWQSHGTMPIHDGTYFEKNSGLLFTDISTTIILESGLAHVTDMETYCNGIYFAGNVELDWSMPGVGIFAIDMHSDKMHGKFSQIQHFFSHFNKPFFFTKIPLEANVDFHQEGGHLHFDFEPGDYQVQALIKGVMTDGKLTCDCENMTLQEVGMNFEYDHLKNTLEFSDIQGTLLVGDPDFVEEYGVTSDRIFFSDYENHEAEFDIWVGDKTRDIVRFAGNTQAIVDEVGHQNINLKLNRTLSHFGDIHPSAFELILKDWEQVDTFRLDFDFRLKSFLSDLQRFWRSGLFFLSSGLIKEIKGNEGQFNAVLQYDQARSQFSYDILGNDVQLGKYGFKKFQLSGNKKGSKWMIDQLQLDNISLALDILKDENLWNVNFFGARFGAALLLGLEGKYHINHNRLEAKVNLLEADLQRLSEWPKIQEMIEDLRLSGQIRATGLIDVNFDKSLSKGFHADVEVKGSLRNGSFKGLNLEDIDQVSFYCDSNNGFVLKNVGTALKTVKGGLNQGGLFLRELNYNFINREMLVDGLNFNIPAKNLGWLAENLQQSFPESISPALAEIIRNLKNEGNVQGALRLSISEPHRALRLTLEDGLYQFMSREHDLSKFSLDFDPFALNLTTEYRYQNHRFLVKGRSSAQDLDSGELVLTDLITNRGENQPPPLVVHWKLDPQHGYYIQNMSGHLAGMTLNLVRDVDNALSSDAMFLSGRVDVNLRKLKPLMDPTLAAKIAEWEVGDGYVLNGQWRIRKEMAKSLSNSLNFQGDLHGRDFEFYGYQFYELGAHLTYSPDVINVYHLLVADLCGRMQVDHVSIYDKGNGDWQASVPKVIISELKPSLMRSAIPSPLQRVNKSLVIRHLEVDNLHGIVGDRNSFVGMGKLLFANPPKKNFQDTIFAIPAEILTRIGLDLAVLTPVRGSIDYDIRDGKFVLKKFKDVYSKGKMSKFYLSNSSSPSFIDFDGNVNVQVRMKQYNLIFKLAELFTFSVQGTVSKPTYTLQKQS